MKKNPNFSSFKSTILFIELRKKLISTNIKVESLFTSQIWLRNPQEIDRRQFDKILVLSAHGFNDLEATNMFNELKHVNTIPTTTFIYAYYETDQRYPLTETNKISDKYKQIPNEKGEGRKQVLEKILLKLQNYLQENNWLDLFREADQEELHYLTKRQFSKLLILTDIAQFTSKDIRNLVINSLYAHQKDGKITKQRFIRLFKLKKDISPIKAFHPPQSPLGNITKLLQEKQKLKKKVQRTEGPSKSRQKLLPSSNEKKAKIGNQNSFPSKNISVPNLRIKQSNDHQEINPKYKPFEKHEKLFKKNGEIPQYVPEKSFKNEKLIKKDRFEINKKPQISENYHSLNIPQNNSIKQHPININVSDIMNFRQIFSSAFRYYRLGTPSMDELPHFEVLEGFIEQNMKFVDKNNPTTHIGTYKTSEDIFKGQKYEIFMMAGSVRQREKSRIGVTRQIQPKDIMQGQLGDCYFLSSIASIISFYPELIWEKIIFSVSPARYYVVKLFVDGEWKMIVTDDSFPCNFGKPVFAKPHGRQIWVMLLEKCWAKIFKSYKAISSGKLAQGFGVLTGAPTQYIYIQKEQDKNKVLEKLKQAFKKRHVTTISGSKYLSSLSKDQKQKLGLVSNHAFQNYSTQTER